MVPVVERNFALLFPFFSFAVFAADETRAAAAGFEVGVGVGIQGVVDVPALLVCFFCNSR